MSTVALSAAQRRLVQAVIQAVLPQARVQVFGSRATGRARPHSDLDLLLLTPPRLGWQDRAALRERFEASELPFTVDVVALDELAEGYRDRVLAESRPL